jgi:hypothetical protein
VGRLCDELINSSLDGLPVKVPKGNNFFDDARMLAIPRCVDARGGASRLARAKLRAPWLRCFASPPLLNHIFAPITSAKCKKNNIVRCFFASFGTVAGISGAMERGAWREQGAKRRRERQRSAEWRALSSAGRAAKM